MTRLNGYRLDGAIRYHYGQFPPQHLDFARLMKPLGSTAAALARYDALLRNLHNKDLLLAPLRRQEAVISSRIEGTVATLDEVLKFEAEKENEHQHHVRHEIIEVHSYSRALTHAQNLMNGGLPICRRLIEQTHGKLLFLGRGADKQPGQFKRDQNYIVDKTHKEVLFVPISAEKLDDGISVFEKFLHDEEVEPLIQTALSHAEFEALHPFKDGNGRMGRMLVTLFLWSRGLISDPHFYISAAIEDRKEEYIDRLRSVSADGQWTEWCIFFFQIIEAQAKSNVEIAEKIDALYSEMKEKFREVLASQWSIKALDFIFGTPVFRNSTFTAKAGIPRQTAARFSRLLSDAGLLRIWVEPAGSRPSLLAFEPLLEIVRA